MKILNLSNVLIASAIFSGLMGCKGYEPDTPAAKKIIESSLVDPESVQYRDVRRYTDGTVCGHYNAKNRMGGYTGFEPFIYWKQGLIIRSRVVDNMTNLCSEEHHKVEVIGEHFSVDFRPSKAAKKKDASVGVFAYMDASKPPITLEKRHAIETIIKQVFDGSEPEELEGDKLNAALLNALLSDKELSLVQRVSYVVR